MTAQEVKDYILAQLVVPVNLAQKVINAMFKIVDYTSTSVAEDIIPDWTAALIFEIDGTNAGKYCKHPDINGKKRIFETKIAANVNNSPPSDPGISETAQWKEFSQSASAAIPEWAAGLFGSGLVIVYHTHSVEGAGFYRLIDPVRPYNSTNIETEITAGDWERIGGSGSGKGVAKTYADIAAMLADQAIQKEDFFYLVTDASTDATVDAGWAVYQKLAASTADLTDYRKLAEAESIDVIIAGTPDASETVAGKVEEGTDAEVQAGTATGGTGAKLFVSAAKLATWWTWVKTQAQTFAAQITFTSAPRLSSTTASQFLKVDSNKDVVSFGRATVSDIITGTDVDKTVTSASLKEYRDLVAVPVTPSAGSATLNCDSKQEVRFLIDTITAALDISNITNKTNAEVIHIAIPITGSNIPITFPSDTRMSRWLEVASGDGWYQSTKILQVSSSGTADLHEFSLIKIGSVYKLNYDGPTRA